MNIVTLKVYFLLMVSIIGLMFAHGIYKGMGELMDYKVQQMENIFSMNI